MRVIFLPVFFCINSRKTGIFCLEPGFSGFPRLALLAGCHAEPRRSGVQKMRWLSPYLQPTTYIAVPFLSADRLQGFIPVYFSLFLSPYLQTYIIPVSQFHYFAFQPPIIIKIKKIQVFTGIILVFIKAFQKRFNQLI